MTLSNMSRAYSGYGIESVDRSRGRESGPGRKYGTVSTGVGSDISRFARFVQETLRRFREKEVLSHDELNKIRGYAAVLSGIVDSDDVMEQLDEFFVEMRSYCALLCDKVMSGQQRNEKRAVEEEENETLRKQLREEKQLVGDLVTRIFPGSPVSNDSRKEVARVVAFVEETQKRLMVMKAAENEVRLVMDKVADGMGPPISGDLAGELRRVIDSVVTTARVNGDVVMRVAEVLRVKSHDGDIIVREIQQRIGWIEELNKMKDKLAKQNERMEQELDLLVHDNEDFVRTKAENETLTRDVKRRTAQLETVVEENKKLRRDRDSLLSKHNRITEEQASQEKSVAVTECELSDTRSQLQSTCVKLDETKRTHESLQMEFKKVSQMYATLKKKYETLDRSLRKSVTDLTAKSSRLEYVAVALQRANEQTAELKKTVDDYEVEHNKHQLCEFKIETLTKENEQYREEMRQQESELAEMRSSKSEYTQIGEKCAYLADTVAKLGESCESERAKVRQLRVKLRNAEANAQKVVELERMVKRLTERVADQREFKSRCDQHELTIATLTTRNTSLESDVASVAALSRELKNSSERVSQLEMEMRDYQMASDQLISQNHKLKEEVRRLSSDTDAMASRAETVKERCRRLESENEQLQSAEKDFGSLRKRTRILKRENEALTETVRMKEAHNSSLTNRAVDVERQLRETEHALTSMKIELESRRAAAEEAGRIEQENMRLRNEGLNRDLKFSQLENKSNSCSNELSSKASMLENVTQEMIELKNSRQSDLARIRQLEMEKRSLAARLEKSTNDVDNYEQQLADLQAENEDLGREAEKVQVLEASVNRLQTENRRLRSFSDHSNSYSLSHRPFT